MASSDDDQSVARYVLAYLIEMNYNQTTAAFLQECDCLRQTSSSNVMILPKTPLKTLINDHQARQNTGLMIKTLGAQQAWKSLWTKLQQTLEEISTLAQDALPSDQNTTNRTRKGTTATLIKAHTIGKSRRSSVPQTNPHITTQSPLSPRNSSIMLSSIHTSQSYSSSNVTPAVSSPLKSILNYSLPISSNSTSSNISTDNRSPRKKRIQTPKRKEAQANPSIAGSSRGTIDQSEDVQQLLDSLMSNEELPWRLAELINQHVSGSSHADNPGSSSSPHTGSSNSKFEDSNEGNVWLDDLINSVFPTETLPKTPPLNQEPVEAVSAEVISLSMHETGKGHGLTRNGGTSDKNHKRPSTKEDSNYDEGQRCYKRPRTDQTRVSPTSDSSTLRLPDGVNLEQFLDQIHK